MGQKLMLGFFRVFDVRVGYFFMAFAIPFYLIFHRNATRAMYHYFHLRLGQNRLKSALSTVRNHYLFGQMMLDRFSLYAGRGKAFKVEVVNQNAFTQAMERPEGFVQAGSHVGNFEMGGYLMHQDKKIITSVIFGGEEAVVQMNRYKILQNNNIELIPVKEDLSHLFAIKAALDHGNVVSMPCDRLFGSNKSVRLPFLGAPADFPLGGFMLAAQTEVDMIAIFVMKDKKLHYTIHVCPLTVDRGLYPNNREIAKALAAAYAVQLERIIQAYPLQWFNFYDFWKINESI